MYRYKTWFLDFRIMVRTINFPLTLQFRVFLTAKVQANLMRPICNIRYVLDAKIMAPSADIQTLKPTPSFIGLIQHSKHANLFLWDMCLPNIMHCCIIVQKGRIQRFQFNWNQICFSAAYTCICPSYIYINMVTNLLNIYLTKFIKCGII